MTPPEALTDLLGIHLQRGAEGRRGDEAAVSILVQAGMLTKLQSAVLDVDEGEVVVEWLNAITLAERLEANERALVLIAAQLAGELGSKIEDLDASGRECVANALLHALS